MANPTGKGGFGERKHAINRKGRPRSFDALRELAQQIGHEKIDIKDKKGEPTGQQMSVTEAILRQWAQSKNPQLQRAFMEIAYGKVPDRTELTGADGGAVTIRILDATEDAHD